MLMIEMVNPLVGVVGIEVARSPISVPEDNVRLYQPLHIIHALDTILGSLR